MPEVIEIDNEDGRRAILASRIQEVRFIKENGESYLVLVFKNNSGTRAIKCRDWQDSGALYDEVMRQWKAYLAEEALRNAAPYYSISPPVTTYTPLRQS